MPDVALLDTDDDVRFLEQFRHIVVSGPQRSGTTYASRALSYSLGFRYVDEDEIKVRDADLLRNALRTTSPSVIQAPGCSYLLHTLKAGGVAVVWIVRPLPEIERSQKRVSWGSGDIEIRQYEMLLDSEDPAVRRPPEAILGSAEYKIWAWRNWQSQSCLVPCFELPYHSSFLIDHPLYVGDRKNFGIRQWSRS